MKTSLDFRAGRPRRVAHRPLLLLPIVPFARDFVYRVDVAASSIRAATSFGLETKTA